MRSAWNTPSSRICARKHRGAGPPSSRGTGAVERGLVRTGRPETSSSTSSGGQSEVDGGDVDALVAAAIVADALPAWPSLVKSGSAFTASLQLARRA